MIRHALAIIFVFLLAMLGNIVAPALLGINDHMTIPLSLIAFLLFFGAQPWSVTAMFVMGLSAELFMGLPIGTVLVPMFGVIAVIVLLQKRVDIRPFQKERGWEHTLPNVLSAAFLLILWWAIGLVHARWVLGMPVSWSALIGVWRSIPAAAYHMAVFGIMIFLLSFGYRMPRTEL